MSLVTLCRWSHRVTSHTVSPVTLCHRSHRATGHTVSLVTPCHWSHCATGHTVSLVTLCHWSHCVTGHTVSLVTHKLNLHMEGPGKLVAALCLHSLHIGAMEGVESKVLHFSIVLATERVRDGYSHSITLHDITLHG